MLWGKNSLCVSASAYSVKQARARYQKLGSVVQCDPLDETKTETENIIMKNQSLLFMAGQEQARSPFLWAMALRIRQQNARRPSAGIGPIPDSVVEWTPRRLNTTDQH
jgi:hypothetical protein